MPMIHNMTEHAFAFPQGDQVTNAITIPRGEQPRGESGTGAFVPGMLEVSDAALAQMKASPVSKNWFEDGPDGRAQLIIKAAKESKGEAKVTKT